MRCLPSNLFQQVRHIIGTVEFLRQCYNVATLACSEVVPLVEFGVYLERCFLSFLNGDLYQRLLP